jgi:hypothetical protein
VEAVVVVVVVVVALEVVDAVLPPPIPPPVPAEEAWLGPEEHAAAAATRTAAEATKAREGSMVP